MERKEEKDREGRKEKGKGGRKEKREGQEEKRKDFHLYLTPDTKIQSINNVLNVKPTTVQLQQQNVGENLCDNELEIFF